MKYLLLALVLTGCSSKYINATLFLKEDDSHWYNLQGKDCLNSGYQLIKNTDGETFRIVSYYSNCDVHSERTLKEFEIEQWVPKKGPLQ